MKIKKILYVEDESDIRLIVTMVLNKRGVSVSAFGSGQEAIAQASEISPDLILLDLTMSEMDGIATLKHLREIPGYETVPCVFLTAKVDHYSLEKLNLIQHSSVISKPFSAAKFFDQLQDAYQTITASTQ